MLAHISFNSFCVVLLKSEVVRISYQLEKLCTKAVQLNFLAVFRVVSHFSRSIDYSTLSRNNNAKARQDIVWQLVYVGWFSVEGCIKQEVFALETTHYC